MKVKDLLESLKHYKPEDEIYVLWYDKEEAEMNLDSELPEDIWAEIVEDMSNSKDIEDTASSLMYDLAKEALPSNRSCNTCRTEGGCRCDSIHDRQAGK